MPLNNWSTTPLSNSSAPPYGAPELTTTLAQTNNIMRQIMADTRQLAATSTIASAATCDIGANDATFLTVTGTTGITSLGSTGTAGLYKWLVFEGALTLTHNATSLILPGSANITTAAGDTALVLCESTGNWRCVSYMRKRAADTVNVKDYGAKGDGVTDDTAAFNSAITHAASIYSNVLIPEGKFYINGAVALANKVCLLGNGRAASEIYFGPSGSFTLTGTSGTYIGYLTIEKLGLTNQGGGAATGLSLNYATRVTVKDCTVYNTDISVSGFNYITFDKCDLFGGTLSADHPTINSLSEAIKFSKCNGSGWALSIKDTADTFVDGCSFLGSSAQIAVRRGEQPANYYAPVFITNTVVDSGDDEGILLDGCCPHISNTFVSSGRTNLKDGINLNACVEGSLVNVQTRYNGAHGINIIGCKGLSVIGCSSNDNKGYGIRLADSSYITLAENDCSYIGSTDWYGGSYAQTDGIADQPGNCTYVTCINNKLTGNSGNALYLPSATNTVFNNQGYTTSIVQGVMLRNGVDLTMALGDDSYRFTNVHTKAVKIPAVNVADLPAAASSEGQRQFVGDANATTFASVVAGGGANKVPVYCDGTNWRIG